MANEETFVFRGEKKLRRGFTTGSCAAGAAAAAVRMLLTGESVHEIRLSLPGGGELFLTIEDICVDTGISCAVRKDAGDDPDVTDGILVYSKAEYIKETDKELSGENGLEKMRDSTLIRGREIVIDGGEGIGRITRKGLDQPPGEAAINTVPRQMIRDAVEKEMEKAGYDGSIRITVSIPGGKELAKKTFNPRLGIEGGLSILGTTGIVEPMSDAAYIETMKLIMRQKLAGGEYYLIAAPGNYGKAFVRDELKLDSSKVVICSNYIGEAIDMAAGLGAAGLLLVGHIGKLCKLAAGVMNTHSKVADARQEVFCACAVKAGASMETALKLLDCATTEESLEVLKDRDMLPAFLDVLMDRIEQRLSSRAGGRLHIGAIIFANDRKCLGKTTGADKLLSCCCSQDYSLTCHENTCMS